jgi:cytochrome c-type biogenesis protein CcmE
MIRHSVYGQPFFPSPALLLNGSSPLGIWLAPVDPAHSDSYIKEWQPNFLCLIWDARKLGVAMKITPQQLRIGIASVLILGTIGYLAYSGAAANKSYYVTVAEMQGMGEKAHTAHLRVEGFVKPQTIQASGTHVTFVLTEFESHNPKATPNPHTLLVNYQGSEPPPDTFKGDAQALAIGTYGEDGVFHATQLQAKCASKYAPAAPGSSQPGQAPAGTKSPTPDKSAAAGAVAKPTA